MARQCGCGCSGGCCTPEKRVVIDFLYLDLDVCDRCQGTDRVLDEAVADVKNVLEAAGYEVVVNKVLMDTKEKAIAYKLVTSPTIRINGVDIDVDVKETPCADCGDLCGDNVDCRTWVYGGKEYTVPPKALIVDAILKAVYGSPAFQDDVPYTMPENLEKFFAGIEK